MDLVALVEIGDSIGTFVPGQRFKVLNDEYAELLIAQKRAERFENRWNGLDWRGDSVCIIASGPSLTEEQCQQVKTWQGPGHRVIAINTSFRRAPWADVVYACDSRWWKQYEQEVRSICTGELWSQDQQIKSVKLIQSQASKGLNKAVGVINQGNNGGYQAVGLAYQAGAKKIILLGFDMHGGHWHGDHPQGLKTKPDFKRWIENFGELAADLKEVGVEVINCSPGSLLKCFPMADLKSVL